MARNKYPEETVNRILDESLKLFLEKGYDRTTIQDIINNLGGLSKGAIYHHFKSKEEILNAVTDRMFEGMLERMREIRDRKGLTGKEKLLQMVRISMREPNQETLFSTAPDMSKNPQLLALQFQQVVGDTIPHYVEPIIRQGAADGSIPTEYPKQLAEVLLLLSDIWLNPLIFHASHEEIIMKFNFMNQLFHGAGLDFLDEVEAEMKKILKVYSEKAALGAEAAGGVEA